MEPIRRIQQIEQIKVIGDERRLTILKLLMPGPATLSQLGQSLGEHPARVRHHLKQLEKVGLVELVSTRIVRGFVEKYYQATAQAFFLQATILPTVPKLLILGSHDLALELLIQRQQRGNNQSDVMTLPVGSLEGLIGLRQGTAQIAGCHLLDAQSGEYNLPFVRHLFPDRSVTLLTLVHRLQGLIVAPGNPHQIHRLEDLERSNVVMINRNRGSGTRLWLDQQLHRLGLPSARIRGYDNEMRTHTRTAEAVAQGKADVCLGLQAAALRFHLDFIPLFQERFDLVMSQEQVGDINIQPLLNDLQSAGFRQQVASLGGYDTQHTGDQVSIFE
jgi:molybdate-binding protein/DNA-binding HxlR family transcriptional regulator